MTLRKGQRIANWIIRQGYKRSETHRILFYLDDSLFDMILNGDEEHAALILKERRERSIYECVKYATNQ